MRPRFQSTPAFSGEGTFPDFGRRHLFNPPPPFQARERRLAQNRFFNPPPPFQAREHGGQNVPDIHWFQSTPAFSGEGTVRKIQFQSTPAFSGEGTNPGPSASLFQSTPAFSGEGTVTWASPEYPRLFRRHEPPEVQAQFRFNPPPPFQARAQSRVSIHPRLFRRGNLPSAVLKLGFNPPPPFQAREHISFDAGAERNCFNPPPPFQAREQSTPAFSGEGTELSLR